MYGPWHGDPFALKSSMWLLRAISATTKLGARTRCCSRHPRPCAIHALHHWCSQERRSHCLPTLVAVKCPVPSLLSS